MNDKDLENLEATTDAPAPELEADVKEEPEVTADDTPVEPDMTDMPDSSGNKPDDGVSKVKAVMQKLGIMKKDEPEAKGDPIPDEFIAFAKNEGWDDETIENFASELSDDELIDLISQMSEVEEELEEAPAKEEAKPNQPSNPETDQDKVIAELKEELATIKSQIEDSKKASTAQQEQQMLATANQMFDEAAKDFEVFGKTSELLRFPAGSKKGELVPNSPAMKARSEVFTKAMAFMNLGESFEDSMKNAMLWYKGANLERDVHRKVIKDLKKHETKLSAKRSGKETVTQYDNEEERQAAVVREAARRAGVKGQFDL